MKKYILHSVLVMTSLLVLFSCKDKEKLTTLESKVTGLTTEVENLKEQQIKLDLNKKVVMNFYQEFFGDKDFSAAEKYIGDVYIQHNPAVADGKEALVKAAKVWLKDVPKSKINFHNVIAEDDLVFTHLIRTDNSGTRHSTMDVFRVTNGKLSEHWDAFAQFKKDDKSANDNPLF